MAENELAVTREEITKIRDEGALFNRRIPVRGFSYTLTAQFLFQRLLEGKPWVTIKEITAVGGREKATAAANAKTRTRLSTLFRQALDDRIFIIKDTAPAETGHDRTEMTRIFELESATEHDLDLAQEELARRIRRSEISASEANAISEALRRSRNILLEDEKREPPQNDVEP